MSAGMRVLVVEDEMLVALLVEDMLVELGYEVVGIASRLAMALTMAETLSFDVAILDVNLAGEKSFPVAEALESKGIPYIFATGYGRAGLDGGHRPRAALSKPFRIDDLRTALAGVV